MGSDTSSSAEPSLREAGPADAEALAALLADFLGEHDETAGPAPDAGSVARWLAPPDPAFHALLGLHEGRALGYLAWYSTFSLFKPGPVMLVENLYVRPEARRLGLGRLLMREAARQARALGYGRMELHVLADNLPVHAFYQSLGLRPAGESVFRIEDEVLRALAETPA